MTSISNKLDITLKTKPYPHQSEMIQFASEKKKVLFLCDVGIGKSLAAIGSLVQINCEKILVVTPACVMGNFQSQINQHSNYGSTILKGSLKKRSETLNNATANITITNYEALSYLCTQLRQQRFDAAIFDEIHRVKSYKAKCSRAAQGIAEDIPVRIGLTGTLDAPADIFGVFKVLDPLVFGTNFYSFSNHYIVTTPIRIGKRKINKVIGSKNIDNLKRKIAPQSLRFRLDDVADIPSAIEKPVIIEFEGKSRSHYASVDPQLNPLSQAIELQKRTFCNEKIDMLNNCIASIQGEKVVIWCRFIDEISKLSKLLNAPFLTGEVPPNKKDEIRHAFRTSSSTNILICQLQVGVGWEVPEARHSIFVSLDFSRTHLIQAKGRNRRITGSNQRVVYTYLLMKDSIDEAIYECLLRKDFQANDFITYQNREVTI